MTGKTAVSQGIIDHAGKVAAARRDQQVIEGTEFVQCQRQIAPGDDHAATR
ncbi:hypothetical protein [Agrobacterium vitis]|uniref:hypothetical protein n=1 Tax=Agrobacterium vitis TaxID=373 RepID=UPI001F47B880|nr:hypothetical protein [Agrobacterium vitis]